MGLVLNCREFDRLWNERLDDRSVTPAATARAALLAEHAAGCDACRGRGMLFARFESSFGALAMLPPASTEAIGRWRVTVAAAAEMPTTGRATLSRRELAWAFTRVGAAAAVAAGVMVGAEALLPLVFPIEPAPIVHADRSSSLMFEEAFSEATSMTLELAREVSAPAARIGSEALGLRNGGTAPVLASRREPADARPQPNHDELEPVRVELISGSARHAFRFLIGTTPDAEAESAAGY